MFLTIAHAATLYYHVHVILHISNTDFSHFTDKIVLAFRDQRPKFFTMWCFAIQTLLFLLCLLHDVSRVLRRDSPARRAISWLRDLVFSSLAMPIALQVAILFWVLFTTDRNLVMPPVLDAVLPNWMNHILHTNIVVLVGVELLAEKHVVPSLKPSLLLLGAVSGAYIFVLFDEYARTGLWLYPILAVLTWPVRVFFVMMMVLLLVGLQLVSRAAVRATWGEEASAAGRWAPGSRSSKKLKD